jgi:hypothetical protein
MLNDSDDRPYPGAVQVGDAGKINTYGSVTSVDLFRYIPEQMLGIVQIAVARYPCGKGIAILIFKKLYVHFCCDNTLFASTKGYKTVKNPLTIPDLTKF